MLFQNSKHELGTAIEYGDGNNLDNASNCKIVLVYSLN